MSGLILVLIQSQLSVVTARVLFSNYSFLKQKTDGTDTSAMMREVEMLCQKPASSLSCELEHVLAQMDRVAAGMPSTSPEDAL